MSQFHTDEYVDFLYKITPDNAHQFAKEQVKCACFHSLELTNSDTRQRRR